MNIDTRLTARILHGCRIATLTAALAAAGGVAANPGGAVPEWDPVSSERLVRLPGNYLDRAVDQSFRASPLGEGLAETELAMGEQARVLGELRAAAAGGPVDVDTRHRLLTARDHYLELMERQHELRGAALQKRLDVYRATLDRLDRDRRRALDPQEQTFVAERDAARERLERSTDRVDAALALIAEPDADGAYGSEYQQNLVQIRRLQDAIARHEMHEGPVIDGEPVSRAQYLRHLIVGVEAERALLAQERQILGHMARLVALDARALEVEVTLGLEEAGDGPAPAPRAREVVDLFIGL
jgi:hypothetical protein